MDWWCPYGQVEPSLHKGLLCKKCEIGVKGDKSLNNVWGFWVNSIHKLRLHEAPTLPLSGTVPTVVLKLMVLFIPHLLWGRFGHVFSNLPSFGNCFVWSHLEILRLEDSNPVSASYSGQQQKLQKKGLADREEGIATQFLGMICSLLDCISVCLEERLL